MSSCIHMPIIHQASIFHLLHKLLDCIFTPKSKPSSRWESDTHRDSGDNELGAMISIFSGEVLKFLFTARCSSDSGELDDYHLFRLLLQQSKRLCLLGSREERCHEKAIN